MGNQKSVNLPSPTLNEITGMTRDIGVEAFDDETISIESSTVQNQQGTDGRPSLIDFQKQYFLGGATRKLSLLGRRYSADSYTTRSTTELFWQPPKNKNYPLEVKFRCACFDVSNVNTASLSAEVKFVVVFFWEDYRFKNSDMTTNDLPGELWGPDISLDNALVDCNVIYDSFSLVDPSVGKLKRTVTFHGNVWNPMDLKAFPFDKDDLELKFLTNGNWRVLDGSRFGNDPIDRSYVIDPLPDSEFFFMGCSKEMHEFNITGWSYDTHIPRDVSGSELEPIVFEFRFHLVRRSRFYYWKIFFPLWLLVFSSSAAFSMDIQELGARYEFLTTVLLSIVGFLYIVQESIPKIGFLTIVDQIVILSLMAVVASIFSSYFVTKFEEVGDTLNTVAVSIIQGLYWTLNIILILPSHIKSRRDHMKGQMTDDDSFQKGSVSNEKNQEIVDLTDVSFLDLRVTEPAEKK